MSSTAPGWRLVAAGADYERTERSRAANTASHDRWTGRKVRRIHDDRSGMSESGHDHEWIMRARRLVPHTRRRGERPEPAGTLRPHSTRNEETHEDREPRPNTRGGAPVGGRASPQDCGHGPPIKSSYRLRRGSPVIALSSLSRFFRGGRCPNDASACQLPRCSTFASTMPLPVPSTDPRQNFEIWRTARQQGWRVFAAR